MYPEIVSVFDIFTGNLGSPSKGGGNLALYFMNEWLVLYISLSLAGGLITWYNIFLPVRNLFIKDKVMDHPYVKSPVLSAIVWIVLAAIMLPFVMSSLLFEDKRNLFIKATYEGAK